MKNTLEDLNNHLFIALERLNEDGISSEDLNKEIERARSVALIAHGIIENQNTILKKEMAKATVLDAKPQKPVVGTIDYEKKIY